jgi:phosphate transport system protein
MSKHLERDIQSLESEILAVSAVVEGMIRKACRALREKKADLAAEVIEEDQYVDDREVHIEEECLKILALHQPVAIDLRRVAAILKINNDLERIADQAVNIAEQAQQIAKHPEFVIPQRLERMSEVAISMVRASLDAFVHLDVEAAQNVRASDDEVDSYNMEVANELYQLMKSEPQIIKPALHCFCAARQIERIADHATNIAEDVVYLVRGEIARHQHTEINPDEKVGLSRNAE